jgi:hypothetical protein
VLLTAVGRFSAEMSEREELPDDGRERDQACGTAELTDLPEGEKGLDSWAEDEEGEEVPIDGPYDNRLPACSGRRRRPTEILRQNLLHRGHGSTSLTDAGELIPTTRTRTTALLSSAGNSMTLPGTGGERPPAEVSSASITAAPLLLGLWLGLGLWCGWSATVAVACWWANSWIAEAAAHSSTRSAHGDCATSNRDQGFGSFFGWAFLDAGRVLVHIRGHLPLLRWCGRSDAGGPTGMLVLARAAAPTGWLSTGHGFSTGAHWEPMVRGK